MSEKAAEIERNFAKEGTRIKARATGDRNQNLVVEINSFSNRHILILLTPPALSNLSSWGFHSLILKNPSGETKVFEL
jgi:hypothetical protein